MRPSSYLTKYEWQFWGTFLSEQTHAQDEKKERGEKPDRQTKIENASKEKEREWTKEM